MLQNQLFKIRQQLESMEEPIIFILMERMRYSVSRSQQPLFLSFWEKQKLLLSEYQTSPFSCNIISQSLEQKLFSFYFEKVLISHSNKQELLPCCIFQKDAFFLQMVLNRLQLGVSVAQAKYQKEPLLYQNLLQQRNTTEIYKRLTNVEVEQKILMRIREKACFFQSVNPEFSSEIIVNFYKDCIIPLTKEVELEYLLSLPLEQQ